MFRSFATGLILFLAIGTVGNFDYADALATGAEEKNARVHRALLETSGHPATLDECQRAHPNKPRADGVISLQNGSGTPWHHRICWWLPPTKT